MKIRSSVTSLRCEEKLSVSVKIEVGDFSSAAQSRKKICSLNQLYFCG